MGWWLSGPGSWGSHAHDTAAQRRARATSAVTTRAAIIRAELAQLERHLNDGSALDSCVAGLGASR